MGEGLGMEVDRPDAAKFGMEIVNIDSSNKSKRSYVDSETVGTVELQQTPLKKQKRATARMDVG